MTLHNRSKLPRWAAFLAILLLLPPTLTGSICLRDDRPGSFELDCACTQLLAMGGTVAISLSSTEDCGPCRDVQIGALAGHLPNATGIPLAGVIGHASVRPQIEGRFVASTPSEHVGVPRGRPPAVLRC